MAKGTIETKPISVARGANSRRIKLAGSAAGLFATGFVLPPLGMIFAVIHSLVPNDIVFGRLGTFFLVASIPLISLGSHLMDVFERNDRQ